MPISENNPYIYSTVCSYIDKALKQEGYIKGKHYEVDSVPNIVDISYGRDVGYSITKHDLGEDVHKISATKIRQGICVSSSGPSKGDFTPDPEIQQCECVDWEDKK